jgi:hypothetical protein
MKFKNRREKQLFVSSVSLRKIGPDKMPKAIASGCLADYVSKRSLLTVAHAPKKAGKWAIELRYEPGRGTKLYSVGAMNFLKKGTLQSGKLCAPAKSFPSRRSCCFLKFHDVRY